jgi:hypothetical protein
MGEEDLLGALVALEMIEPAFVIEEKRPPPVEVSWAATREAAATTRTEVNFMVIDLLLVLVLRLRLMLILDYCSFGDVLSE